MKAFIKHDGKNISLIHYQPFDKSNGLGKTEQELKKLGEVVNTIPTPEKRDGYYEKPFWDEKKKEIYYEYFEIPDDEFV